MCAKKAPRTHNSPNTPYFLPYQSLISGQVLPAQYWLKRHRLPLCLN